MSSEAAPKPKSSIKFDLPAEDEADKPKRISIETPNTNDYNDRRASVSSMITKDAIKEIEDEIFAMFLDEDDLKEYKNDKTPASTGNSLSPDDISSEADPLAGKTIELKKFIQKLETTGLHLDDVRLKNVKEGIKKWNQHNIDINEPKTRVDQKEFHEIVKDNIDLIYKAIKGNLVIPDFEAFCNDIKSIYHEIKSEPEEGANASYIPQLDNVDSNFWGISVCTVDGQRFTIGDVDEPFTVQSTSKAINYAIALSKYGEDVVHSHIGREPSGRLFNEIALDEKKHDEKGNILPRPHNPMINAGAIMTVGIIEPHRQIGDRFDDINGYFKKAAGNEYLSFNASIFLSERENADRNNCLAYYMKEAGCYKPRSKEEKEDGEFSESFKQAEANFKQSLELYFQLCSLETTAQSSSVIASTLANGGICPTTNEEVFKPDMVKHVLSLMLSCGMYDYSGQFAFSVGLPAKSGVSGSLLIVIPNLCGICCFAPPLDKIGNSTKGVKFARKLVDKFCFHNFDNLKSLSASGEEKKDPRKKAADHSSQFGIVNVLFAAADGDLETLQRYHLSDFDLNGADYDDRTPLRLRV